MSLADVYEYAYEKLRVTVALKNTEIAKLKEENALAVAELLEYKGEKTVLLKEIDRLRKAVLNQEGDKLCWIKDEGQAKALPEAEFMESCRRHRLQIASTNGEYAGLRTIAQLEAEVVRLQAALDNYPF